MQQVKMDMDLVCENVVIEKVRKFRINTTSFLMLKFLNCFLGIVWWNWEVIANVFYICGRKYDKLVIGKRFLF